MRRIDSYNNNFRCDYIGNYLSNYRNNALAADESGRGAVVRDNAADTVVDSVGVVAQAVGGEIVRCVAGCAIVVDKILNARAAAVPVVDGRIAHSAFDRCVGCYDPDADFAAVVDDAAVPRSAAAVPHGVLRFGVDFSNPVAAVLFVGDLHRRDDSFAR